jgi:hypothetical protein
VIKILRSTPLFFSNSCWRTFANCIWKFPQYVTTKVQQFMCLNFSNLCDKNPAFATPFSANHVNEVSQTVFGNPAICSTKV